MLFEFCVQALECLLNNHMLTSAEGKTTFVTIMQHGQQCV